MCIKQLAGIAMNGDKDAARVAAIVELLARGWGRSPQVLTGPDGGALEFVIRQIVVNLDAREAPHARHDFVSDGEGGDRARLVGDNHRAGGAG